MTQTKTLAVDLESGRVYHLERPTTGGLRRTQAIEGVAYYLEEWAIVDLSESGAARLIDTSSSEARNRLDAYATVLEAEPGTDMSRRYLVLEAAHHTMNWVEPLVRLESLETGALVGGGSLADGRVVIRASFSPHGDLDEVQAIEGNDAAAWTLAEDLRVEFPLAAAAGGERDHEGHRSVVFAVYEVDGGLPRLVAAVPIMPQCCCDPPCEA